MTMMLVMMMMTMLVMINGDGGGGDDDEIGGGDGGGENDDSSGGDCTCTLYDDCDFMQGFLWLQGIYFKTEVKVPVSELTPIQKGRKL